MVGSLVIPADMMSQEAATPQSTKDVVDSAAAAVEHFGEDLTRSVNLQKRKTEMYGTLIVDTMQDATTKNKNNTPNSPSSSSPGKGKSKWTEPMDEVSMV